MYEQRLAYLKLFQCPLKYRPPDIWGWFRTSALPLLLLLSMGGHAQPQVLVDFRGSHEQSVTPYPGWNQLIYHPQYMAFTTPSANPDAAGIAETNLVAANNYTATYAGIKGSEPILFERGDKIIATFYNQTSSRLRLQARLSFTDEDAPNADYTEYSDWDRPWYTMYAQNPSHNDWVGPGEFCQLVFNITDASSISAPNAKPTEGSHTLVNISMDPRYNAWHGAFVLTKIEYARNADVTPPDAPTGLSAQMVAMTGSDLGASAVELSWQPSLDSAEDGQGSGVNRYGIYRNGQFYATLDQDWIQHYLRQGGRMQYQDLAVLPGETYEYQVTAIDSAVTGHYRIPGSDIQFGNESNAASVSITVPQLQSEQLILGHNDIKYIGAFRLPLDYQGQNSAWHYASTGLAFYPGGNLDADTATNLPGSLYGIGHPLAPQISEFSIPRPIVSDNPNDLRRAQMLKPFTQSIWPDVYANGWQPAGGGDPVVGITYHQEPGAGGDGLYYSIFNSYNMGEGKAHGYVGLDLGHAIGAWHIGGLPDSAGHIAPPLTDRYLLSAPKAWANQHSQARSLLVGQGYQSGEGIPSYGPTLFAISPTEKTGGLPADNDVVDATVLLRYGTDGSLPGQWLSGWSLTMGYSGAAWLQAGDKSAVAFAVSRPLGDTWYGGEDGSVTFTSDLDLPMTRGSSEQVRGPMATERQASLYLYNPNDLAKVASGEWQPWQPQPYQVIDLKQHFMPGSDGREPNVGAISFDAENGFLYMIQANADTSLGAQAYNRRSIVYVWKVGDVDQYAIEFAGSGGDDDGAVGNPIETSPTDEPGFILVGSACHLDIDGNGLVDPETDGYLLYRYLDNWQGDSLVDGRIGDGASRIDAESVRSWMLETYSEPGSGCHLDIDGDGIAYAQTDGFLAYRYMQGLTGWQLTNGIVAANATRKDPETILSWVQDHYGEPMRSCHLDVDGDGLMLPQTDGYMLYRYLDNYDDTGLLANGLGAGATRTTAPEIRQWLQASFSLGSACHLDVDGDGVAFAGTDGSLLYRFLQGKQGDDLTNGVVAAAATRQTPEVIRQWLLHSFVGEN